TRREDLSFLEAETADGPKSAHALPSPFGRVRLARILYHREIVLLGDCQNLVHVCRCTRNMDGQDGASMLSDPAFDVVGVYLKSPPISIRKDRKRVAHQDDVDRGDI